MMKIDKFKKREWNADGLERELSYCVGETGRPSFKTGRAADLRFRSFRGDVKPA
jgi:hypothetical protein